MFTTTAARMKGYLLNIILFRTVNNFLTFVFTLRSALFRLQYRVHFYHHHIVLLTTANAVNFVVIISSLGAELSQEIILRKSIIKQTSDEAKKYFFYIISDSCTYERFRLPEVLLV